MVAPSWVLAERERAKGREREQRGGGEGGCASVYVLRLKTFLSIRGFEFFFSCIQSFLLVSIFSFLFFFSTAYRQYNLECARHASRLFKTGQYAGLLCSVKPSTVSRRLDRLGHGSLSPNFHPPPCLYLLFSTHPLPRSSTQVRHHDF